MLKVGDPVEGYCRKCRDNRTMFISATDGREVFKATCRSCQTQQNHQPERSAETLRARAMKKLERTTRRKVVTPRRAPEVVSRRRDARGEGEGPVRRRAGGGEVPPPGAAARRRSARNEARRSSGTSEAPASRTSRRRSGTSEVPGRRVVAPPSAKPEPVVFKAPKKPESAEVREARKRWKELTSKLSSRDGKPYFPDRTYAEGDVLLHKRHGMGVVESVVNESAIMVLFRDKREVIEMAQPATR